MKHAHNNPATHFAMLLMALAMAFTFLACEEKGKKADAAPEEADGPVKLLESIKYSNGDYDKFEYDDKNRIVKMVQYKGYIGEEKTFALAYSGDDLFSIQGLNYGKNGNTITISDVNYIITIDNDGYIIKTEQIGDYIFSYQYSYGNLIKRTQKATYQLRDGSYATSENVIERKYDDKKSPFYNCKTPKWFLMHQVGEDFGLKSNVIEYYNSGIEGSDPSTPFIYKYEYDGEGYPTKQTAMDGQTITFTYRGESLAHQAEAETPKAEEAVAEETPHEIQYGSPLTYEGQTYKTVVIGKQTWTAENLENEIDWATAMTVCPSGWHLPSDAEWDQLFRYADGKSLKATSGWQSYVENEEQFPGDGDNKYGFAALPTKSYDSEGYWWSSSEYDSNNAYSRTIHSHNYVERSHYDKGNTCSVRCVKD